MAWNPSPEVAVARDAADKLGDGVEMCIVFWVTKDLKLGSASWGRTKELCDAAREVMDGILEDLRDERKESGK